MPPSPPSSKGGGWYNLADLLDDQGRSGAAIECLRKALVVLPDYMNATFNLALLLQREGDYADAADHWRRYLATDRLSEWATRARRSRSFAKSKPTRSPVARRPKRVQTRWLDVLPSCACTIAKPGASFRHNSV